MREMSLFRPFSSQLRIVTEPWQGRALLFSRTRTVAPAARRGLGFMEPFDRVNEKNIIVSSPPHCSLRWTHRQRITLSMWIDRCMHCDAGGVCTATTATTTTTRRDVERTSRFFCFAAERAGKRGFSLVHVFSAGA